MKSQSTQAWPAREVKKPWKGLSTGTPKLRNPSVGLPPLSQAASWAMKSMPARDPSSAYWAPVLKPRAKVLSRKAQRKVNPKAIRRTARARENPVLRTSSVSEVVTPSVLMWCWRWMTFIAISSSGGGFAGSPPQSRGRARGIRAAGHRVDGPKVPTAGGPQRGASPRSLEASTAACVRRSRPSLARMLET